MSKETEAKKIALVMLVAQKAIEKAERALQSDDLHLLCTSEPELTAADAAIGDLMIWLLDTDHYNAGGEHDALLEARDEIWRLRPAARERYGELLSHPYFDDGLHSSGYPSDVALDWIKGYDCYEHGVGNCTRHYADALGISTCSIGSTGRMGRYL